MEDFTKSERYLKNRLVKLTDEKTILVSKINNIEIQIEEIDLKINEISKDVDNSFEIFSPHAKKNDFIRDEIDKLKESKKDLLETYDNLNKHSELLDEDIAIIKDALGEDTDYDDEDIISLKVNNLESEYSENNIGIKILEDQESERKRIANELHDSTIQVLTNLVHKCEIISRFINVDSVRAKLELEIMAKTLRESIDEMRNIIYDLRPMSMDDLSFDECMHNVIDRFDKSCDIEFSYNVKGRVKKIPNIKASTIIRVVKEAINNSIHHSKCKKIDVCVEFIEDTLKIVVQDDGKGFDVESIVNKEKNNFGITIMKERIYLLNGSLSIESENEKGTKVIIEIPVE